MEQQLGQLLYQFIVENRYGGTDEDWMKIEEQAGNVLDFLIEHCEVEV